MAGRASKLYQPYDIKGHTALITGASSGIGEATALRLAEAGCKVILVARRADRLEALAKRMKEEFGNGDVHCVTMDVRDSAAVDALPTQLPAPFADVDILVNNAGLALGTAGAHEHDMDQVQVMLDTNVSALLRFTRAFAPQMVARDRGHIVNVSSIAGHEAYAGGAGYCASKSAVDAFTTAARHDLVGTRVRVTAVSPGAVETEFSVVRFGGDKSKADAVYEGIEPLTGPDIADNIMYSLTRPEHVQIADVICFATYQSSAKGLARVLKKN
ncbi:unnamed protein product [Pedinophyceae sp. YPF-701]|nr:unnamed protein product [Pedinophyceae sp. YPF-701]